MSRANEKFWFFCFWLLFAINSFYQIDRAPKYDALKLIVTHFHPYVPAIDSSIISNFLFPFSLGDILFSIWLFSCFIALRCAFGIANQVEFRLLLPLFSSATYFISQTDDFQHHFLVILFTFLFALFASNDGVQTSIDLMETPPPTTTTTKTTTTPAHISLKSNSQQFEKDSLFFLLAKIQLSLVYFWTALAKLDSRWFSGESLMRAVSPFAHQGAHFIVSNYNEQRQSNLSAFSNFLPILTEQQFWVIGSLSTIFFEFFLMIGLHIRSLRTPTFFVGITLHTVMHFSGLRIGLFSYFMIVLFLMVPPPSFESFVVEPWVLIFTKIRNNFISLLSSLNSTVLMTTMLFSHLICFGYLYYWSLMNNFLLVGSLCTLLSVFGWISLSYSSENKQKQQRKANYSLFSIVSCLLLLSMTIYSDKLWAYDETAISESVSSRQFDVAERHARHMIHLAPNHPYAYSTLAFLLRDQKRWEDALQLDRHVLEKIDSNNLKALAGKALYYGEYKRNEQVICSILPLIRKEILRIKQLTCSDETCEMEKKFTIFATALVKQFNSQVKCIE